MARSTQGGPPKRRRVQLQSPPVEMKRTDFSASYNNPDDADVLLHISTADPAASQASQQQPDKTLYVHAVILKAESEYFRALLSKPWQQQLKPQQPAGSEDGSAHAGSSSCVRYELVEYVEVDELDAMQQLLQLMYSPAIPFDASVHQLLQLSRLADRYRVVSCIDKLLLHLAAKTQGRDLDVGVLTGICTLSPGLHSHSAYHTLMENSLEYVISNISETDAETDVVTACRLLVVHYFQDVSSVICSDRMRQQFCELPHAAVLAWVGSDQLQVQSENCVVYLLSAWVEAQQREDGQGVSAERLEQLAHQVRVLQLGPAYQEFVLPNLEWFKGCSGMAQWHTLMAYKGATSTGVPVFPLPTCEHTADSDWEWGGPAAWVAGPRQVSPLTPHSLLWDLGPKDRQLFGDDILLPGLSRSVLSSQRLYVNGFQLCLGVAMEAAEVAEQEGEQQATLGMYFYVSNKGMSEHGVPWPDTASVSVSQLEFRVKAPAGVAPGCCAMLKNRSATQRLGLGTPDVLRRSAPTFKKLVAPLLVGGKLQVEMKVEGIDLPA